MFSEKLPLSGERPPYLWSSVFFAFSVFLHKKAPLRIEMVKEESTFHAMQPQQKICIGLPIQSNKLYFQTSSTILQVRILQCQHQYIQGTNRNIHTYALPLMKKCVLSLWTQLRQAMAGRCTYISQYCVHYTTGLQTLMQIKGLASFRSRNSQNKHLLDLSFSVSLIKYA